MEIDQTLKLADDHPFDRAVLLLGVFFFVLGIVLVSVQVVFRYLPLDVRVSFWTEPLARFALIVGTYLGAAVASRNTEHIRMTVVSNWLVNRYPRAATVQRLVVSALIVCFLVVALVATANGAANNWGASFGGMPVLTLGQIYVFVSAALLVMLGYELRNAVVQSRSIWRRTQGETDG